ncbi:PREDICTED: uncharacterized protein LOC105314959 [Amphimedon queenslandica]|uniref:Lysosome-associated membrane glycoprotein 2-like transmembrane domain-containing protein n=1 Tax=Amphimedon queenslandica TaxID=400682 RepID=A0A1X7TEQ7_AMPQE|nr:PREDICTED: uncharacterized protein LOC105314959 [Amphimedon queenslandica]|eukprot:XP_011407720.1 PREDICTED: uncharacterized protein LOC105314959 [Amphimedon queenslandica]
MAAGKKGVALLFLFSCLALAASSCTTGGGICFKYFDIINKTENKTQPCLFLDAEINILVAYNDSTGKRQNVSLGVNCSTVHVSQSESFCNEPYTNNKKNMRLTRMKAYWGTGDEEEEWAPFDLMIEAIDLKDNKQWNISEIAVSINVSDISDYNASSFTGNENGIISGYYTGDDKNHELFGTVDYNKFYYCKSQLTYSLKMNTTANPRASYFALSLSIKKLRVQAYGNSKGFSDKCSDCYQDSTGKAFIPIVVGSVIGGLVLVVLVSYIVGRFRNHYKKSSSTGYEKLQ